MRFYSRDPFINLVLCFVLGFTIYGLYLWMFGGSRQSIAESLWRLALKCWDMGLLVLNAFICAVLHDMFQRHGWSRRFSQGYGGDIEAFMGCGLHQELTARQLIPPLPVDELKRRLNREFPMAIYTCLMLTFSFWIMLIINFFNFSFITAFPWKVLGSLSQIELIVTSFDSVETFKKLRRFIINQNEIYFRIEFFFVGAITVLNFIVYDALSFGLASLIKTIFF